MFIYIYIIYIHFVLQSVHWKRTHENTAIFNEKMFNKALTKCGLFCLPAACWQEASIGMGRFGPGRFVGAVLAPDIVAVCRFRIRKILKRVMNVVSCFYWKSSKCPCTDNQSYGSAQFRADKLPNHNFPITLAIHNLIKKLI